MQIQDARLLICKPDLVELVPDGREGRTGAVQDGQRRGGPRRDPCPCPHSVPRELERVHRLSGATFHRLSEKLSDRN